MYLPCLGIDGNVKIRIFVWPKVSLGRGQSESVSNVEEDFRKAGLLKRVLKILLQFFLGCLQRDVIAKK
jgi:hypothetical protein